MVAKLVSEGRVRAVGFMVLRLPVGRSSTCKRQKHASLQMDDK